MSAEQSRTARILVDGHGGDHAPDVVVEAVALLVREQRPGLRLGLVGRGEDMRAALSRWGIEKDVEIIEAEDVIEMTEAPALVLRGKRRSSMHVGTRLVRDGTWHAFVSAGNTGALMAISKTILKTLPGIDRPAIASMIPTKTGGHTLLIDSGANVDCTSSHLIQFAFMGSCYMQAVWGLACPRVGLLNIGKEEIKGTDVVKVAASELQKSALNFVGNVEGTDIFEGTVDVVVCDGFVGNVALKSMEGAARLILHHLKHSLEESVLGKVGMLLSRSAIQKFREAIDPAEHNGAPLLGLKGVVVKSHGSADAKAFANAVDVAMREVKADLSLRIMEALRAWESN